jgi:penicillin-binding protein 2
MAKFQRWIYNFHLLLIIGMFLISGCVTTIEEPTYQVPTIAGNITDSATAQAIATQYLQAWQVEDYNLMYAMLTPISQDAIDEDAFRGAYQEIASALTLASLDYRILSSLSEGNHAEVAYRVSFDTLLVGELRRETVMNLTNDRGQWRVQWNSQIILPELQDGYHLEFVHEIPSRGRIFDNSGAHLAAYENAIAVGVVPGEISPDQAQLLYETLSEFSGYTPEELEALIESTPDDWYLPIITLSQDALTPYMEAMQNLKGIRIDEFRSRYYVDGGVAPHVLGYRLYIPEEDLDAYLRLGYRQDELVGAAGLEAAYEAELSGKRGGSLYLVGPDGKIQSLLATSGSEPGQSIYTTLDKQLQAHLQASLGDLRAAVVVMEIDTGRVLAMVSNPHFDPNAFGLSETDQGLLTSYFTDEDQPLFNRATQGQYPWGSVFKTITMSAGLENNLFRESSSFYCGQSLFVCDAVTLYDWTYAHGASASGQLTLKEGLMRSCNPWFYWIGESLYSAGMENALSEMAIAFGLGAKTGIEIQEAAGNIPDTAVTCVNSAQLAIGQGEILVTPLQVATFYAALANGGTLYRPALVQRITPASDEPTYEFEPEIKGELPISEETRQSIVDGLRMVIEEQRGTGYWAMQGLDIPVSGKTGTAQTPPGNSHAWFAGFTRQNDPERPDIAIAVIVENGGEGSAMAAPIFRRAVSLYFSNYQDPSGLMPWEEAPYVPLQPTPTPTPESTSDE